MNMEKRNITTIPATLEQYTFAQIEEGKKRRTAGYARVSTIFEEQLTSYAAQVDYYTSYIQNREDWEFVEVYTDEGISATNTRKREGFKRMIRDALSGKIDLIVTKSVSRFARNTVDSLTTIRKLKEKGVEVYFEKENIWTFDSKGELLITIMSSLAQEESRSISENCIWGQRKRFADGKVSIPFTRFLGYDRGSDGNLIINQEQAAVIRKIYDLFLQGITPYSIAQILTEDGIRTPTGKQKWNVSTVRSILTNEKYKGDALLQKSYTTDFLTKKRKVNEGEIPQYYVENNHEAIIEAHIFDMVQREMMRRSQKNHSYSGIYAFSSRIQCGQCGGWYGSKVWHTNSKYRKIVWQCNHKFKGTEKCNTPHLTEEEIKKFFVTATNQLLQRKKRILEDFWENKDILYSTYALELEQKNILRKMQEISSSIQDEDSILIAEFEKMESRTQRIRDEIAERKNRRLDIEGFMEELEKQEEILKEFEEKVWFGLVEHVVVNSREDIRVVYKDGTEIKVKI